MARKFFYICAGMFLLALSYHFGASTAGASGGTATVGLAAPTEVTVLSGVLPNGATIPLPTFADGTTALESECHWTVSTAHTSAGGTWAYTANTVYGEPPTFNNGETSFYLLHPGRVMNTGTTGCPCGPANYLIIATRGASQPTTTLHESWGQVKARYQNTPGTTVTPGADSR